MKNCFTDNTHTIHELHGLIKSKKCSFTVSTKCHVVLIFLIQIAIKFFADRNGITRLEISDSGKYIKVENVQEEKRESEGECKH